ncbi:hypothetical protein [Salibacterium sp. K-3]
MGEKGTVMPVLLIICFLFTSMLLFQAAVFVNEKQSVAKQEQVLQLEWLLRNGEKQWKKEGGRIQTEAEKKYDFQDGSVEWEQKAVSDDISRLTFTAVTNTGYGRTRSYFLEAKQKEAE